MGVAAYGQQLEPLLRQAAGYALSILHNRAEAEDAVQQAALRGLERIESFDPGRPFKGWWFAILRNCCIDALRRRETARLVEIDRHEPTCEAGDTERWEALAAALERVTVEHREILRMRYFGDLSYRELAEALGIPKGTVMSRLHLARKALAKQMRMEVI